jgi:hypothetical protein
MFTSDLFGGVSCPLNLHAIRPTPAPANGTQILKESGPWRNFFLSFESFGLIGSDGEEIGHMRGLALSPGARCAIEPHG